MAGTHQIQNSVSSTSASSSSNLSNSQDELLNCGPPELLSPSVVFADALMSQIKTDDVQDMVQAQREMLMRFEKTNEMLLNFNMLSASRYNSGAQEFRQHTQLLYQMKKDLDVIFKRIRSLNQRLGKLYPGAFSACSNVYDWIHADDEELPVPSRNNQTLSSQAPSTRPPNSQVPSTRPPSSQAPSTRPPTSQAPSTRPPNGQAPSTQSSSSQAPSTRPPSSHVPSTQPPSGKAPSTQPPGSQEPSTQSSSSQAPSTQPPASKAPSSQTSNTERSSGQTASSKKLSSLTPSSPAPS